MPAALPLQSAISQTSQAERTYRVLEVRYGNGYSQRAPDGINNVQDKWNVEWGSLSLTDFTTVVNAIDAAAGVDYFTWQAPGDSTTKKWVISKFTKRAMSGAVYSVSASLTQEFDL